MPNELLADVTSYLSVSSLNALVQTSRELNYIVTPILFARALGPSITNNVLSWAANHNSVPITKYLLASDVFVTTAAEICSDNGRSPLQRAAANGFVDVVRAFIDHRPELNVQAHEKNRESPGRSPMMLAARNGHLDVVRVFIDAFIAFEWGDYPAFTKCQMDFYYPLQMAIRNFHELVVHFLFHHLDPSDWPRIFPHAAASGWDELVTELLPLLTEFRDEAVAYAMRRAAGNGHIRCVEELVEHVSQGQLKMALRAAARGGHDGIVVFIMEHFEDKADASTGALYDAVAGGSRDVLNLLLAYGCDVNATLEFPRWDKDATILYWIAVNSGRQLRLDRICAMMLAAGADRDTYHKYYRTPLYMMKAHPPKEAALEYSKLCRSYGRVQQALMDGCTHEIVRKWMDGLFTLEEAVWHDRGFVKKLAEEVDIQFVESPRSFLR